MLTRPENIAFCGKSISRNFMQVSKMGTNKLNQISKRVNQRGIIYKSDIDDMKKSIEKFLKEQKAIHSLLLKRKK